MEESRLKQRLVGAVVLVALAVIFIPMLLSSGRDMEMPVFGSNVPDRSVDIRNIKHIDIAEMKQRKSQSVNPKRIPITHGLPEPKIVEEKKSIVETIVDLTKTENKKKSVIKETVWAVQVGSFANRKNALALKDKLRKKKIHAFVERVMKNSKAIYRVRVGPESSQRKAIAMKKKLKKEMKLSGLVVKHP